MSAKQIAYLVIAIIAIIAIIFMYGKYKGKQIGPKDVILPSDTQAQGVSSTWNPGFITDALFNDLNSTFSVHDSSVLSDTLLLSNSQLVAVNNDWNQRYYAKSGNETLVQALEGDLSVFNYSWDVDANTLIKRLKTLVKQ